MIQRMRGVVPGVLLAAVWVLPAAARGDEDESAKARSHYRTAQTHYNLGEFREAAEQYMEAYRLKPTPLLLFNIAQAWRLAGEPQRALFHYRRYLGAMPAAANRTQVEEFIAALDAQLAAAAPRSEPPAAAAPAEPAPAAAAPPSATPAPPAATAPPAEPPRPVSPWPWVALGGTAAALAGAGAAYLAADAQLAGLARAHTARAEQENVLDRTGALLTASMALVILAAAGVAGTVVLFMQP
jgi:tetratricopeptide (TPR) repeat protein